MFEDNFESGSHLIYNMENFQTFRRKISHFEIQQSQEQTQEHLTEALKEDSAKNTLINLEEAEATHPLKPRDQKNIVNGWIPAKSDKEKPLKSFRTKICSKSKVPPGTQFNSLRNSFEEPEGCIPKLKNILKKLESPERDPEFGSFKENTVYSDKREAQFLESSSIPYKFESAFHTLNTRRMSREKRRRIITFSDYKESSKKAHPCEAGEEEPGRMSNLLVIKQAGRRLNLRR